MMMAVLDLAIAHEMQINKAIKNKEWKVALEHIEAMKGLIPKEKFSHDDYYNVCDCTDHAYHDNCIKCGCSPN